MATTAPSIEQIKSHMRAIWMAGDFGVVAKAISGGAEDFVGRLNVTPGARALDVACGTGNLAMPLARAGAVVTGVDIATNLLEQARERAVAENVAVTFVEGDAEQLPFADGTFDVVVSMFGAMFAPRPEVVASELARVLKPGGILAMANWNVASFSGRMFKIAAAHVPPPSSVAPSVLWGEDTVVRERFGPYFEQIETKIIPIQFKLPTDPAGAVAFFRKYFGPMQMTFSRLDEAGQAALTSELEALWSGANISADPARTIILNEYLEVQARRR